MTPRAPLKVKFVVALIMTVGSIVLGATTSRAQSPSPASLMTDYAPLTTITTLPSGQSVAVVEGLATGLGSGGCQARTAAQVEATTIRLMGYGIPVIDEITPQGGPQSGGMYNCDPNIKHWESLVASITDYVKTHTSVTIFPYYWYGIMLDEEDGFWITGNVKDFEDLNEYTQHLMAHTYGVAWFYTEDFASLGSWNQAQYNDIVHNDGYSIPAPEIYNDNMASLANGEQSKYNDSVLVTWDCHASDTQPGYNSGAYATSRINGPPYIAPNDQSLSNEFTGEHQC